MKVFPWTLFFFPAGGRLLVYFSTHQHLYVPSLSFHSDKGQIRAIDHVQGRMNYSAAGARLDAKSKNVGVLHFSFIYLLIFLNVDPDELNGLNFL